MVSTEVEMEGEERGRNDSRKGMVMVRKGREMKVSVAKNVESLCRE